MAAKVKAGGSSQDEGASDKVKKARKAPLSILLKLFSRFFFLFWVCFMNKFDFCSCYFLLISRTSIINLFHFGYHIAYFSNIKAYYGTYTSL